MSRVTWTAEFNGERWTGQSQASVMQQFTRYCQNYKGTELKPDTKLSVYRTPSSAKTEVNGHY